MDYPRLSLPQFLGHLKVNAGIISSIKSRSYQTFILNLFHSQGMISIHRVKMCILSEIKSKWIDSNEDLNRIKVDVYILEIIDNIKYLGVDMLSFKLYLNFIIKRRSK